jgi:hypothetical protein
MKGWGKYAAVLSRLLMALGTAACGSPPTHRNVQAPPDPLAAEPACSSGVMRDPNEAESELMMPGHACNACHNDVAASTGETPPIFRFAGTVYLSGHEPDDCVGSAAYGAQVWITDSKGVILSARVNKVGNFSLETSYPSFTPPFTAKVRFQGRERQMLQPQSEGDCNTCHTSTGEMDAPGRIVLP